MLTKEKIKQWLLENCVKDGKLDLSGLDFSDFYGEVDVSCMKVGGNLVQNYQEVSGNLMQNDQKVGLVLWQSEQTVGSALFQDKQKVGGDLWQDRQTAENSIYQSHQKSGGDIYQADQKPGINLFQDGKIDRADAPKPSILKVIDRFADRESTAGFIEDYEKYVK